MPTLTRIKSLLRNFFAKQNNDRELDDELRSYIDQLAEDKIRAGMKPEEARRAARIELGGVEQVKENVREIRVGAWFDSFLQDLRYGARMLRKNPGFTAVAVLTLALGIGANTAMFSVINAVLLRPLPYTNPQQLLVLQELSPSVGVHSPSYPDFLDWRKQSKTMPQMAALNNRSFNLSGVAQPENINGYAVSPNCLSLFGVRPILGRDFLPSEETPGTAPVALLSYALWQSHFGADPNISGKNLTLDGQTFAIVGVLPPNIRFLDQTDLLAPIGVWAGEMMNRGDRGDMAGIGRLAPGASVAQARAEMDTIAANLRKEYPINAGISVSVTPLRVELAGDARPAILVLFGAVVFVLLIACVNVANLFLARSAARAREIAVRQACGASSQRLVRQMLTESFVLAVFGGGLGIAAGALGIQGLRRLVPTNILQGAVITMDRGVLLFSAAMVVLVAVAFGLAPAWQASQPRVHETLKEGGRSSTSGAQQNRLRSALVIAETALALVLLVGAGLMMKSMYRLLQVNPGFRPERALTMEIDLRTAQYSKPEASLAFWHQVLDRVRVLPGVEAAALGTVVPLTGDHSRADVTIEGMATPEPGKYPHPDYHSVSAGYLDALTIPLLRGRNFAAADTKTAPPVALVNYTMAHRFWPNGDAIGKRLRFGHPEWKDDFPWITVVGVVGDTKLYGLSNPSRLELYLPYEQSPTTEMSLVLRSSVNPASLTSAVREAVLAIDKDQPVADVNTMTQLVNNSVATPRITLVLLGLFSALALVLAAIGTYGVIAYSVQQRTHELGIRLALGAQRRDVMRLVLAHGMKLAGIGIAIGVAAAFGLTRLMASLLFGTGASDPIAFSAASIVLLLVAVAACCIPARRAMRLDPMVALRYE
jgi:putative ABC transport system permease protein